MRRLSGELHPHQPPSHHDSAIGLGAPLNSSASHKQEGGLLLFLDRAMLPGLLQATLDQSASDPELTLALRGLIRGRRGEGPTAWRKLGDQRHRRGHP